MREMGKLKWRKGRAIIEIDAVIRVPIEIEPVVKDAIGDVQLTRRERETLEGLLKGWSNKEIANPLNLSARTVKSYVSALLAKFGVRGRGELIALFGAKPGESHDTDS